MQGAQIAIFHAISDISRGPTPITEQHPSTENIRSPLSNFNSDWAAVSKSRLRETTLQEGSFGFRVIIRAPGRNQRFSRKRAGVRQRTQHHPARNVPRIRAGYFAGAKGYSGKTPDGKRETGTKRRYPLGRGKGLKAQVNSESWPQNRRLGILPSSFRFCRLFRRLQSRRVSG